MDPISYYHYVLIALRAYHGFPPAKYGITDDRVLQFDKECGGRGMRSIELELAWREFFIEMKKNLLLKNGFRASRNDGRRGMKSKIKKLYCRIFGHSFKDLGWNRWLLPTYRECTICGQAQEITPISEALNNTTEYRNCEPKDWRNFKVMKMY